MRRPSGSLTTTALLSVTVGASLGATALTARAASAAEPDARQAEYAAASAAAAVPLSVLLGVSYLESRWDTNRGAPSTSAGYGPMHLTDAAALAATSQHHDEAGEDARGDDGREPKVVRPTAATANGPALQTLDRAVELTGTPKETLRTDPAANIRGGAALLATYQREAGGPPGTG